MCWVAYDRALRLALKRSLSGPLDVWQRTRDEIRNDIFTNLRKVELQKKARAGAKISPIPTPLMDEYVRQIQMRLRAKKIGYKKEFLGEILKE